MMLDLTKNKTLDCESDDLECTKKHIKKVMRTQKFTQYNIYIVLIMILGFGLVHLYEIIKMEYEEDPLTITATENNPEWIVCQDRVFTFERHVKNTKFIRVSVEPRMVDLKTGVVYVLPGKTYEGPPQDNRVTYRTQIPEYFPSGDYEYIPTLSYDVNPRKAITKQAPSQKVKINCNNKPLKED